MSKSSDVLNECFNGSKRSVRNLFEYKAEDTQESDASFFDGKSFVISTLGMINHVLRANGLEPVAAMIEDGEIVGFCDYKL